MPYGPPTEENIKSLKGCNVSGGSYNSYEPYDIFVCSAYKIKRSPRGNHNLGST